MIILHDFNLHLFKAPNADFANKQVSRNAIKCVK